MKREEAKGNGI
jgi:hypothetical protein